jgi:hypothetical protein
MPLSFATFERLKDKSLARRGGNYSAASGFGFGRVGFGLLTGLTILGLLLWQHEKSGPLIRFVIPAGFQGAFRIIEDNSRGIDPQRINGEYVYSVPATGTLYVKSNKLFREWHRTTAEYADGTPIASEYDDLPGAPIRLFQLGSMAATTSGTGNGPAVSTPQEDWCFVGTRTQKDNFDWPADRTLGAMVTLSQPASATGS